MNLEPLHYYVINRAHHVLLETHTRNYNEALQSAKFKLLKGKTARGDLSRYVIATGAEIKE